MPTKEKQSNNSIPKILLGGNLLGYSIQENDVRKLFYHFEKFNINGIDTADVYGNGLSETLIGKTIHTNRKYWFISTKAGTDPNGDSSNLGSRKTLTKKLDSSLKRLKTDYIDLYQIHNFDNQTNLSETISTLQQMRTAGKILNYGISNFNEVQLRLLEKNLFGSGGIKSMQIGLNILNMSKYYSVHQLLEKLKIKPIFYGVLARGLLSEGHVNKVYDSQSRTKKSPSIKEESNNFLINNVIEKLSDFGREEFGCSIQVLALAFILNHFLNASMIVGIRKHSHLEDINLARTITIDRDSIDRIVEISNSLNTVENLNLGVNLT